MTQREKRFRLTVEAKQREADAALAKSRMSYVRALNLQLATARIARGFIDVQSAYSLTTM